MCQGCIQRCHNISGCSNDIYSPDPMFHIIQFGTMVSWAHHLCKLGLGHINFKPSFTRINYKCGDITCPPLGWDQGRCFRSSPPPRPGPEFFLIRLRKLTSLTLLISIADTVQTRNCLRNSCDHIDQRRCWDYPLPYLQTRHTAL